MRSLGFMQETELCCVNPLGPGFIDYYSRAHSAVTFYLYLDTFPTDTALTGLPVKMPCSGPRGGHKVQDYPIRFYSGN